MEYKVDTQSRTRTMDLNIESWLQIYSKDQIVKESEKNHFTIEQLEVFLQMINNEVKMPPFLVFERQGFYATHSCRLRQLMYKITELQEDPNIDPRLIRRILSHKLNVMLVEASTKLDPQELEVMQQFYL